MPDTRPYLDFIHEALEQAQLVKDNVLFEAAVADALFLASLERLFKAPSAEKPPHA